MPLSDREQQLLDQIEQALYAEDPKFASSVRSARPRVRGRRWLALCVVGVLAGLGVVFAGLAFKLVVLGVVGFVLIVGSCVYAMTLITARGSSSASKSAPSSGAAARKEGVRSRMEDRLKRRFDEN